MNDFSLVCIINHCCIILICYLRPPILKLDEVIAAPDMPGGTLQIIFTMQDMLWYAFLLILFTQNSTCQHYKRSKGFRTTFLYQIKIFVCSFLRSKVSLKKLSNHEISKQWIQWLKEYLVGFYFRGGGHSSFINFYQSYAQLSFICFELGNKFTFHLQK